MDEHSQQAFEDWEADANQTGEIDQKYIAYINSYIDNEESMRDMLTFDEFSRHEYAASLLEIHEDDELDEEDDEFPGLEE